MTFIVLFLSVGTSALAAQKEVKLAVKAVPSVLKGNSLQFATDTTIFRQLTEGLFAFGDGFNIENRLAKNVLWRNNNRELIIDLNESKFSDGSKLTAVDVLQSLTRCLTESNKNFFIALQVIEGVDEVRMGKVKVISGISAPTLTQLRIKLKTFSPLLLDELTQAECGIVKPAKDGSIDLLKGAVAAGPYKVFSHTESEIVLQKNDYYRIPSKAPTRVSFVATPDYEDFEKIRDWVALVTLAKPAAAAAAAATQDFESMRSSEMGTITLFLNNSRAPFNDLTVRRLVMACIDNIAWADAAGIKRERTQGGLVPFGMRGFRQSEARDEKEIEQAQIALAKLGFSKLKPFSFNVFYSSKFSEQNEREAWERGVRCNNLKITPVLLDAVELNKRQASGDFQAIRLIKYPGSVEPHRLLASLFSNSTYNVTRSQDPTCDGAIKSSIAESDEVLRQEKYKIGDDCLMGRAFLVPLVSLPESIVLIRKPWRLKRTNPYLLFPSWVSEWTQ